MEISLNLVVHRLFFSLHVRCTDLQGILTALLLLKVQKPIPIVFLSSFNPLQMVIVNIFSLSVSISRRDRAMSGLLTGVVVVLVVCHTPKTIINLSECYNLLILGQKKEPFWGQIVIKISHLLLALSSAINILIYSYKDFKFRAVLRTLCDNSILDRFSHEESVKDYDGMCNVSLACLH